MPRLRSSVWTAAAILALHDAGLAARLDDYRARQTAAVLADYVMVNMVAQAGAGAKSPKDAAAEAQKRAERYYKV